MPTAAVGRNLALDVRTRSMPRNPVSRFIQIVDDGCQGPGHARERGCPSLAANGLTTETAERLGAKPLTDLSPFRTSPAVATRAEPIA